MVLSRVVLVRVILRQLRLPAHLIFDEDGRLAEAHLPVAGRTPSHLDIIDSQPSAPHLLALGVGGAGVSRLGRRAEGLEQLGDVADSCDATDPVLGLGRIEDGAVDVDLLPHPRQACCMPFGGCRVRQVHGMVEIAGNQRQQAGRDLAVHGVEGGGVLIPLTVIRVDGVALGRARKAVGVPTQPCQQPLQVLEPERLNFQYCCFWRLPLYATSFEWILHSVGAMPAIATVRMPVTLNFIGKSVIPRGWSSSSRKNCLPGTKPMDAKEERDGSTTAWQTPCCNLNSRLGWPSNPSFQRKRKITKPKHFHGLVPL